MADTIWPLRIALYGAGQAITGAAQLDTQIRAQLTRLSRVATNRYVAAMAQLNATAFPSVRYVLDPRGRLPIETMPDFDAGDPNVLVQFIGWCDSMCAASETVLVLSGHGVAWEDTIAVDVVGTRGLTAATTPMVHHARSLFGASMRTPPTPNQLQTRALLVDGSNHDFLSNSELGSVAAALADALGKPVGVLVMDACLMSSWEVLHELHGSVAAVVASLDEVSARGIDVSAPMAAASRVGGQMTPRQIAASFVSLFQPQASFDTCVATDLAGARWAEAIGSFRRFCDLLRPWVAASAANALALRTALRVASASIVKFWGGGLADIGALGAAIGTIGGLPSGCLDALSASRAALSACVIGASLGTDYRGAFGMSVFSPGSADTYTQNRSDYAQLAFARDTGWDGVLAAVYAG